MWPLIFDANRNVVADPHWIYPAERLIIPPVLARPLDAAPSGLTPVSHSEAWPASGHPVAPVAAAAAQDTPTIVSTLDLRRPVVSAHEYRSAPWLSAEPTVGVIGSITAKTDPAQSSMRMMPTLYPQDLVNVTMAAGSAPAIGDSLLVVRTGRRVGESGSIVQPMGMLRVERVTGAVVTGRVIAQYGDARVGDVVRSLPAVPVLSVGTASPVESAVGGHVLQFVRREGLQSTTELALLSVGRADGVGIGDELAVYVPGVEGAPSVQVAVVRVVRVEDASSTGRLINVSSTGLREGMPVHLIRQMP